MRGEVDHDESECDGLLRFLVPSCSRWYERPRVFNTQGSGWLAGWLAELRWYM